MGNLKNLFEKGIAEKTLPATSLDQVGQGIESADFIKRQIEDTNRFVPQVDFSNPKNFARYGSAEQYYLDSLNYIQNGYPYDGSRKEKIEWGLSASYLDKFIFDTLYPRTNGYVNFGKNYVPITASYQNNYGFDGKNGYIFVKGGPNTASAGMIGTPLAHIFNHSNIWDPSNNRQSNLEINGNNGITIEFWLNRGSFVSGTESPKQAILDVWNSQSFGTTNHGRFRLEIRPGVSGQQNQFYVTMFSGTNGLSSGSVDSSNGVAIGQNLNITGSSWNQYSLSVYNNDAVGMVAQLYNNGVLNDTQYAGSSIGLITGSMIATLGSLITNVSGAFGALGWGKLSGSVDEFRFWKTRRTAQQIGQYWFTQVGAGTNTDEANTELGVYYKFNEGIVNLLSGDAGSIDSQVLDYSGRISNGNWVGYVTGSRNTGSAMVLAGAASTEFADPIIYVSHPAVSTLTNQLQLTGSSYDHTNNAYLYGSVPEWITKEDANQLVLKKLTQTMASFFDTVHLQTEALPNLKGVNYTSSSFKPYPFVNRFLESAGLISPEIFQDAASLEALASRDDFREFQFKFDEVKNRIYQNVYNNLVYIYKSKGTEKAFRNLIRCFGVDDELIRINLYADQVTYDFKDNFRYTSVPKKYVNFNNTDRFYASVYQNTSSDPLSRDYVSAPPNVSYIPMTVECEVIFPQKFEVDSPLFFITPFVSCSVYGCHTANCISSSANDKTWVQPDYANFQVYAIRTMLESKDVYFMLTGTAGSVIPTLTSSVFQDVYTNQKWNFAVRIKPSTYPFAAGVSGSAANPFVVEFVGFNNILDVTENSFSVTGTIPTVSGTTFMNLAKRFYVGAHRTNFTGSLLNYSDGKISSLRVWYDYVGNETIAAHARDASNFGRVHPGRNAYLTEMSNSFGN